ncbi:MAG: DNA recombination/repair protein RecA, partial [Candidatus Omnitrophota bacterium]
IIDCAIDLGIITKSGSWFSYQDRKLAQGKESTKNLLAQEPKLLEEISKKVEEKIYSPQS